MANDDEDLRGALLAAERDADRSFARESAGSPVAQCPLRKHWVELAFFDGDEPVPDVQYRVTLPDGRVVQGTLNGRGRARIDEIEAGGSCIIAFPELDAMADPAGESTPAAPAEGDGIMYTPGAPATLPLDAAHCFLMPDWDLVELDAEGRGGDGDVAEGSGADDDDDWELVELDIVEPTE